MSSSNASQPHFNNGPIVIVMGVSGCGKSTIAKGVAEQLNLPFVEGDDLHPAANVKKMSEGTPLTDDDRWPWLDVLGTELKESSNIEKNGVVASCSALKRVYRERLLNACGDPILYVYLDGSRETLLGRMQSREDHFMPSSLLDSQLALLEKPTDDELALTVSIENSVAEMVDEVLLKIKSMTNIG